MSVKPKVLFFDIEILPRHFQTNFGADRSTLCVFGYRWGHHKKSKALNLKDMNPHWHRKPFNERALVLASHEIMSQADICVGHYSDKFDFPYMQTKFLKYGLEPIKIVDLRDTWKTSRFKLKLSSNRLEAIASYFGLTPKMDTEVSWWFDIIAGDGPILKKMTDYCKGDVDTLVEVYEKIQELQPAKFRYGLDLLCCPECNSSSCRKNSTYTTVSGTTQVYLSCQDCGKSWKLSKQKYEKLRDG